MAQITPQRWSEMERIAAQDSTKRFSIIVTLKDRESATSLEQAGFQIEHRAFTIVTGSASLAAMKQLAARKDVELLEEDGEVRAI